MTQLSADGQEGAQEKPLHVRVAEALGWTNLRRSGWVWVSGDEKRSEDRREWVGRPPLAHREDAARIPRYDTDWSATGPLLEKYGVDAYPEPGTGQWFAWAPLIDDINVEDDLVLEGKGPTPLIAVCELLLKLGEAGKL